MRQPKRGYFLWFYLLALGIPVGIVTIGVLAPHFYGLESIDEYWTLMDATMSQAGIEKRGSALLPFVRVSLIQPLFWTVNLFAAAPTIAGIVMAWLYFRERGLRDLIDRMRPWRAQTSPVEGLRWWGCMALVLAATKSLEFALYRLAGMTPEWIWGADLFSLTFLWFYLSAVFLDQGGLLEETGWRGYALPRLQDSMTTPLHAALFLGIFWAIWHLPRELANSYESATEFLVSQTAFFLVSVFLTIIISFFFNKTGGSTLIAIAVHGLSNDSVGLSGTTVDGSALLEGVCHTLPYLLVATALLWFSGSQLGRRQANRYRSEEPAIDDDDRQ
jgi:hypothetical protein